MLVPMNAARFQPMRAKPLESRSYGWDLWDLTSAMMTAEGIPQPALCVRLQCDIKTLRRKRNVVQGMARRFGWDVCRRSPTPQERCVRLRLQYTDIMPETLLAFSDPEAAAERLAARLAANPHLFVPMEAKPLEPRSHGRGLWDLTSAMMCAEGIAVPELCVRLQLAPETLERRINVVQGLARRFGWDVCRRDPTPHERCVRLRLQYTDIMPDTLLAFSDPEASQIEKAGSSELPITPAGSPANSSAN